MWPIPIFTDVQVKTITATPSRCPGSKGDHRDPHWRVSLKLNMECRNVQPLSCNKLHFHVGFPREIIYEKLNKTAGFKTGENHRKPLAPSHIFFFLIDILLGLSAKWGMPKEYVCKCIYIYMHMGTMSLVSTMDNLRFQFSFSAFPQGFQPATSGSHPGAEFQPPTCRAHLETPRTTGRKINCEDHTTSYNDMESFSKILETWRGFQAACKTRDLTIFSTPNPADQDFQVGQAIWVC